VYDSGDISIDKHQPITGSTQFKCRDVQGVGF